MDALVGHPNGLDLARIACVDERTPGLEPLLLPGEATMDEVEVKVVWARRKPSASTPSIGAWRESVLQPNLSNESCTAASVLSYPCSGW